LIHFYKRVSEFSVQSVFFASFLEKNRKRKKTSNKSS